MINLLSLVSGKSSPLGLPGGAAPFGQSEPSFSELVNAPPAKLPAKLPFPAEGQGTPPPFFENAPSIARTGLLPPASSAGPLLEGEAQPLTSAATPLETPGPANALPSTAPADRFIPMHRAIEAPAFDAKVATAEAAVVAVGEQIEGSPQTTAPAMEKPKVEQVGIKRQTSELIQQPKDEPGFTAELMPATAQIGQRAQLPTEKTLDPMDMQDAQPEASSRDPDGLPVKGETPDIYQAEAPLPADGVVAQPHSHPARWTIDTGRDPEPVEITTGDTPSPAPGRNDRPSAEATAPRIALANGTDIGDTRDFAQALQSNGGESAAPLTNDGAGPSEIFTQVRTDPAKIPADTIRPAAALPETISARPGEIGRQLGVEIVRQSLDGRDSLTIRLDPVEMGEIQVRLQFDDKGTMRAHVSAESSVALEMLRRDSGDLVRALGDAGVRTDAQSFQFEARSQGRGDQQGQHNRPDMAARQDAGHADSEAENDPQTPRAKLRSSGSLDLFA